MEATGKYSKLGTSEERGGVKVFRSLAETMSGREEGCEGLK